MSEVAAHAMDVLLYELTQRGIATERLLEGTGVTEAQLATGSRLPWEHYAAVLDRFEELVGGPAEMERVGYTFFEATSLARRAAVGLVVRPRLLYQLCARYFGPQMFAHVESELVERLDGSLQIDLLIPDGFRDCAVFFRITHGVLSRFPVVLGRAPARVVMTLGPRRARYEIRLAPERAGRLGRLRHALRRPPERDGLLELFAEHDRGQRESVAELRRANDVIAAQKRALEQSEARWRSLVESSHDFVLLLDREGVVQFVNRVQGIRREDVLGRRLQEVASPETEHRITDGLRRAFEERQHTSWEAPWTSPDGPIGMYHSLICPVVEEEEVTGAMLIVRDVTEARQQQEQRLELERQVLHAQKLESLGMLAGGIAHDFNNLLAGIVSNAGMAAVMLDAGSPAVRYLERVESGAMRAAGLIEQMLAYSGRGRFELRPLDLSALVGDLVDLLAAGLPKSAALQRALSPFLPAVEGDASQLQQVVLNLVTNAADSLGGAAGQVSIRTGVAVLPGDPVPEPVPRDLPAGSYVFVEISDTGHGMDEATLARIFEPFFTTKREGRGLGLAAVQGIVQRHAGALVVRSAPGQGTTFRLFLPASRRPPEAEEETSGRTGFRGRGTVLVVDDEATVREGASSLLVHHGFTVLLAPSGEEALRIFRDAGATIDVVLLDKTMPGAGGAEVFRALRRIRPDVRVVLSSAYDAGDLAAELSAEGLQGFLRKPYRPEGLLDAIRRALR